MPAQQAPRAVPVEAVHLSMSPFTTGSFTSATLEFPSRWINLPSKTGLIKVIASGKSFTQLMKPNATWLAGVVTIVPYELGDTTVARNWIPIFARSAVAESRLAGNGGVFSPTAKTFVQAGTSPR